MKKLFLIILFTSVLSSGAYAEKIRYECTGGPYDYVNWEIDFDTRIVSEESSAGGKKYETMYNKIISYDQNSIIWELKYKKKTYRSKFNYATNQNFQSITNNESMIFNCRYNKAKLNNFLMSKFDVSKNVVGTSNMNMEVMIKKAKDTCKSLGFKEGSDKFADCSLKLYSQSLDLAAEQNKTVVMQPQSSGTNVMTIYDPVRDSNALMQRGMKMLSGRCTLGIDC